MKKSKFLKKSLAALLAILMVVAMIPLSAAAEEAPEPEGPKAPTITVNNATATAPTEEGGAYTATVRDATTVSISWINAEDDYSAWIRTARGVSVAVPFRALDLLTEGSTEGEGLGEDADGNVTYQVHFELKAKDATAQSDAIKSYPLNIKVLASVPNDDTTIRVVRPNQTFRLDNKTYKFIGVDADVDNDNNVITIVLPLGVKKEWAGFGLNKFGCVRPTSSSYGDDISGNSVDRINRNDAVARKVFVPNSVYSTIHYDVDTLTVTSRDGHSRNYTVRFVQEDALSNVTVLGVDANGKTYGPYGNAIQSVDDDGIVTFTIGVDSNLSSAEYWIVSYGQGDNVVRVEDPILGNGKYAPANILWTSGTISGQTHNDSPVRSGQNKIFFADGGSTKYAYLTVKTQANMAPNTENMDVTGPDLDEDGIVDGSFFQNVKIVLRKSETVNNTSAILTELQLNGYQAIWNQGKDLAELANENGEIEIKVDYDFQFSTGDGQHPARISGNVKGTHVSIPAQDTAQVKDDYWRMGKKSVNNGRVEKPSVKSSDGTTTKWTASEFSLDKVNTEDGKFTLRVWNGNDYKDYPIRIVKTTSSNVGTKVSGVHLYQPNADGTYTIWDATSSTGKNWQFKLPDNLYNDSSTNSGAGSTLTGPNLPTPNPTPLQGYQPYTLVEQIDGTPNHDFIVEWNDTTDMQYADTIKGILDAAMNDKDSDLYGVDLDVNNVAWNMEMFLARDPDVASQVMIVARITKSKAVAGDYAYVKLASGAVATNSNNFSYIDFKTNNGTILATGTFIDTTKNAGNKKIANLKEDSKPIEVRASTNGDLIDQGVSARLSGLFGGGDVQFFAIPGQGTITPNGAAIAQTSSANATNLLNAIKGVFGPDLEKIVLPEEIAAAGIQPRLTFSLQQTVASQFDLYAEISFAVPAAINDEFVEAAIANFEKNHATRRRIATGTPNGTSVTLNDVNDSSKPIAVITFTAATSPIVSPNWLAGDDNAAQLAVTFDNTSSWETDGQVVYELSSAVVYKSLEADMFDLMGEASSDYKDADGSGDLVGNRPTEIWTNATRGTSAATDVYVYADLSLKPSAYDYIKNLSTVGMDFDGLMAKVVTDTNGKKWVGLCATSGGAFVRNGSPRGGYFADDYDAFAFSTESLDQVSFDANGTAKFEFANIGTLTLKAFDKPMEYKTAKTARADVLKNASSAITPAYVLANAWAMNGNTAKKWDTGAKYATTAIADQKVAQVYAAGKNALAAESIKLRKTSAAGYNYVSGISLLDKIKYVPGVTGSKTLNNTLKNFLLVIDTPDGAVVTPGGVNANGTAITQQAGVSMWNIGNGFVESWANGNIYTELEKGWTKLGDWWLANSTSYTDPTPDGYYDYLLGPDRKPASATGTNKDTLYFTVTNGHDGPQSVYTITLAGTTNTSYPSSSDDLITEGAIATSAVDEDLVYGGNSVTNAILVRNGALCALPSINNGVVSNKFSASSSSFTPTGPLPSPNTNVNPGWINPDNAAYINDIGGNNLYDDIQVEALTSERNASVVTVMVEPGFNSKNKPYNDKNKPSSIFFSGLSAAPGSTVYRLISKGNVLSSDNGMGIFNLNMVNHNKQANIGDNYSEAIEFNFDHNARVFEPNGDLRTDDEVWADGQFHSEKVSPDNILYVFSAEAKRNPNFPTIVNERDVEEACKNFNGHKYYITYRHQTKKTGDDLVKMESVPKQGKISVVSNNSLKTIELHVPSTYNWSGYRDDSSKDFTLSFELSEGAMLIDAYRDPAFGFKSNKNVTPNLYADFSLTDLTKEMQEVARWTSAGEDAVNPSTFFIKNDELYMINPNTGIETQITGMGDEASDYFIDSRWSQILAQQAELRVYNEARNQVNTYKLQLVIDDVKNVAEITHLTVNESTAVVDNETRKATVKLPSDTDKTKVALSIAVSPQASIIEVNGAAYDPDDKEATYDITEAISIVIEAGDGSRYTYNLIVDGSEEPVPADATITSLTVDGVAATVNNTARTATVELPEGSDLSKVKLAIEVSEGDELVSVAGEEFDPEAEYDLSEDIAIVIKAEDGTEYTYTLSGSVAQHVDPADKYTDLDKIQKEETRDEVKKAINLGLMNGISESKGIFGVGMNMQRFQFALVVARADLREQLLAEDENADVTVTALDAKLVELYPDNYTFTDVSEKIELKAAAAAVQYCYDKGYINGKSLANKIFDPTGNITREEAAKIMVEWAGLEHDDTDVSAIPDGDEISNWAKGYVKAAADAGIMKGRTDGNFAPKAALQRQDGACLLVRTYENFIVNKGDDDNTPDDDDDNNGDDDTNTPDDDENNGDDSSTPDDGDNSSTPDEGGDDDTSSTPDDEDTSSTPDEGGESEPAE